MDTFTFPLDAYLPMRRAWMPFSLKIFDKKLNYLLGKSFQKISYNSKLLKTNKRKDIQQLREINYSKADKSKSAPACGSEKHISKRVVINPPLPIS